MKGSGLHPKDHSIQLFTDASNTRSLRSKFYQRSVVRSEKKATHKRSRIEGGLTGPSTVQKPVSEPNSSSCNGQLNSSSLHKQTRRNSLSGDVCAPVEDHDVVPSLSHNIESQTHSRVSQCDGQPPVQVQPSTVDRMVTSSTGVQADLSKVVATHLNHKLPLYVSPITDPKAWDIDALDGSHCLCLPSNGSPSQGDPKNQAMP